MSIACMPWPIPSLRLFDGDLIQYMLIDAKRVSIVSGCGVSEGRSYSTKDYHTGPVVSQAVHIDVNWVWSFEVLMSRHLKVHGGVWFNE